MYYRNLPKKSTPWGHETYYLLFFDPDLTPRDKMKIPEPYCTSSTRHTQSYPRVSFVISMNCTQSSSDKNFTKTFFGPYVAPGAKMKILRPYCASARHAQSDPRIYFGYGLRCRRSSSDKKFFGRTD